MLWRIRDAVARFMYGRYGIDKFGIALLVLSVALSFINIFVKSFLVDFIETALLVYMVFRMLSRNIDKRSHENQRFIAVFDRFKAWFSLCRKQVKDRSHKYVICPNCKAIVRFPRKKGKHCATCPKCRSGFTVNIIL